MSAKKALLVVDGQVALFHLSKPLFRNEIVLSNIRAVVDQARAAGVPIVYLQHTGNDNSIFASGSAGWQIHPLIAPRPEDIIVQKHKADSFLGSDLEQRLRDLAVQSLVICGFVTEGCIDTTVRRASSLGFTIELVSDAHSTTDGTVLHAGEFIDHHNAILAMFAEVKRTSEIHFDQ